MFETKRLCIRKLTLEDLDAFAYLMSDPLVMEFSLKGAPLSREESAHYLKTRILDHYEAHHYGLFGLIEKKNDALVGIAGLLHQKVLGKSFVELAYRLHPNYWNRGLAQEACKAIMLEAKSRYKLTKLISLISPDNLPSIKLSKKLGFYVWKKTEFKGHHVHIYKKSLEKRADGN